MTSSVTSGATDRQLPTRVSNACERCRRNKSRCDPFRPCSLCVRANTECSSGHTPAPSRATKRRRTQDESRHNVQHSNTSVIVDASDAPTPHLQERDSISTDIDQASIDGHPFEFHLESRRPSVVNDEVDSAMSIAQKIYRLGNQSVLKRKTSAIPGGDVFSKPQAFRQDHAQRQTVSSILGFSLPPVDIMRALLEEYFDSVHWFSLVIYEPKLRIKFESLQDGQAYPSQKPFLILLTTMLGMASWYRSHKSSIDAIHPDEDWRKWALSLMQSAGSQLTEVMDQCSIASVQTCILLGSYYVYHGKPNLSFALLGATIKAAQALGLHRQPPRGDSHSTEERKRVWWTIYTWDRFASVTYGRPLGINDEDCNVEMPLDTQESPFFEEHHQSRAESPICYSSYQRELNRLYLIASPMIEVIFGFRTIGANKHISGDCYATEIMAVTEKLWHWRRHLPPHLQLSLSTDCPPNLPTPSKVHHLQALSLQLTFDNLLIIIHRRFLAQQVDHLFEIPPEHSSNAGVSSNLSPLEQSSPFHAISSDSPYFRPQMSSTEQWWNAALRTSKVTEMPQLAQLATDGHLVAFLAINLFNSAIVMAVLALSDPLSDRAQEVKRTITRIFRLQELLGKKTTLSVQSNGVLKDVIHMLLRREEEAMLAPVVTSKRRIPGNNDQTTASLEMPSISVEDTLRLPIQLPLASTSNSPRDEPPVPVGRALRLNESLASVQRVFPVGFDGIHYENGGNHGGATPEPAMHSHDSEPSHNTWSQTDPQGFGFDQGTTWAYEEPNLDSTGNGLYWFWDPVWDENRP